MTYDYFGRITRSDAPGVQGESPRQYSMGYSYDAFNNLTNRSGSYWYDNAGFRYSAIYENGRVTNYTQSAAGNTLTINTEYNESGQLKKSYYTQSGKQEIVEGPFSYDSVGRSVAWGTVSITELSYDGDGSVIRKYSRSSHTPTPDSSTWYVTSTVLGGQVVSVLKHNGDFDKTNVFANGRVISRLDSNAYGSGNGVIYSQRDPHNLVDNYNTLIDPMGVSVSAATTQQVIDYYQNKYKPQEYNWPSTQFFGGASGMICKIDGVGGSACDRILRMVSNRAAVIDSIAAYNTSTTESLERMGYKSSVGIGGLVFSSWDNKKNDVNFFGEVDQSRTITGGHQEGLDVKGVESIGVIQGETIVRSWQQSKQTHPPVPTPKPCAVQIPSDSDAREIIGTLLGEMTSPGYIGQKHYKKKGDKVGNPTGSIITQEMLNLEAGAMVDVILNRSIHRKQSIKKVVTAKKQFLGHDAGMDTLNKGNFGNVGSADCNRLGIAVGALSSRSFIGPVFPFENWRGVAQKDEKTGKYFIRDWGSAVMRLAHTDFW